MHVTENYIFNKILLDLELTPDDRVDLQRKKYRNHDIMKA
jgi:hypothetical protein